MSFAGLRARGLNLGPIATGSRHVGTMAIPDARAHLRALEDAGVSIVWCSEVLESGGLLPGWNHEAFSFAQRLLHASDRIVIGSGVARALDRVPKSAGSAQWTILDEFPDRYLLGLGASGDTRARGKSPVAFLRDYLAELDAHTARLTGSPVPFPRVLGAYSIGTITVARDLCDGLITALVTPEHTTWARSVLGPDPFLAVSVSVGIGEDIEKFRALARKSLEYSLPLPHQRNKYKNMGFGEADYAPPGSDHLIDTLMPMGPIDVVAGRLREHLTNGADQVNVGCIGATAAEEVDYLAELGRLLG